MRNVLALAFALIAAPVLGGSPVFDQVIATKSGETWVFNVTISHADTGWDHYANGRDIAGPDGIQLGYRKLLHPHVNAQPFTRSLSGVAIPDGMETVIIRAHDSVHGWGEPVEFGLK